MRLSRVIGEASAELATIESVVGGARHVLDVVAETERRGTRIAGRLRTVAVVVVVGIGVVGGTIAIKTFLDRRRASHPGATGSPLDSADPDDID
jgi:hypothetical protein